MKVPIVFADKLNPCPDCGEPYCELHGMHYADCTCLGPGDAEDKGYEIVEEDGKMFGVKK